jgi:hypothetical protein
MWKFTIFNADNIVTNVCSKETREECVDWYARMLEKSALPIPHTKVETDITVEHSKDLLRQKRAPLLIQIDHEINKLDDDTVINGSDNAEIILDKKRYRQYLRDITDTSPLPQCLLTFEEWKSGV